MRGIRLRTIQIGVYDGPEGSLLWDSGELVLEDGANSVQLEQPVTVPAGGMVLFVIDRQMHAPMFMPHGATFNHIPFQG